MAKIPRFFPPQGSFHILARGNNRMTVFHDNGDYRTYLGLLRRELPDFPIQLHHYCLMPNHVHLLLSAGPPATALSAFMQRVQLAYAIYYKAHHEFSGHLWQGRFKSLWVDSERYFFVCSAYVELNPVSAGLVATPGDYPFSSYAQYAHDVERGWIVPHPLYEQLGPTPEQRRAAYQAMVAERSWHRQDDQPVVGFSKGVGHPR